MHFPRSVGSNPPVAGEIVRMPEIGAAGLIRGDLKWLAFVSELLPIFASDNVIDRKGQCWCGRKGCGWKAASEFSIDAVRTKKQGHIVYMRYCRKCRAAMMREQRKLQNKKWNPVPKERSRRKRAPKSVIPSS